MKNLKRAIIVAAGLAAIVASLATQYLPKSGAYTFAATNTGCEVRQEGRQSIYSVAAKRLTGGTERGDSFDRVVRINTRAGESYHYGTGYAIGGNFVLTAGHVVNKGEPYLTFGDGRRHKGNVLKIDSEADVGLVEILSNNEGKKPSGIRIGNIRKGDIAVVKTLDTKDTFYDNGSKSHREVKLTRYDGRLLPGSRQEIEMLERNLKGLEDERTRLDEQRHELLKPYIDPLLKPYVDAEGKESPFGLDVNVKKEGPEEYYSYIGDQFILGMSGSAMFNRSGALGGVVTHGLSIELSKRFYEDVRVFLLGTPESVQKQADDLSDKRQVVMNKIGKIKVQIGQLKNPETVGGVSPKAIVGLLQEACSAAQARNYNRRQ